MLNSWLWTIAIAVAWAYNERNGYKYNLKHFLWVFAWTGGMVWSIGVTICTLLGMLFTPWV